MIGLAKKKETIIFSDGRDPLNLEAHDPALRLLQYIRDEAHHFANSFNAELRSKRLRESILEDFKGLGSIKRTALLNHFGTLEKLRQASTEDIILVEGIGKNTAERLVAFLESTKKQWDLLPEPDLLALLWRL